MYTYKSKAKISKELAEKLLKMYDINVLLANTCFEDLEIINEVENELTRV